MNHIFRIATILFIAAAADFALAYMQSGQWAISAAFSLIAFVGGGYLIDVYAKRLK